MKKLGFTLLFLFVSSTCFAFQMNETRAVFATAMDGGINDIDYVVLEKAKKEAEEKRKEKEEKELKKTKNKKLSISLFQGFL